MILVSVFFVGGGGWDGLKFCPVFLGSEIILFSENLHVLCEHLLNMESPLCSDSGLLTGCAGAGPHNLVKSAQ